MKATFTGKALDGVFAAPASALTDDGRVWVVDGEDRLQLADVDIVYRGAGSVWVRFVRTL